MRLCNFNGKMAGDLVDSSPMVEPVTLAYPMGMLVISSWGKSCLGTDCLSVIMASGPQCAIWRRTCN